MEKIDQDQTGSELEQSAYGRIIKIRTETTLTRYPFHRIAKKGTIKIKQTKQNDRGKLITTWEVRNAPGPLAYKIDTIVINRRIDEMRNRGEIRQLFKVGSLREICEEIGINPSGKNTNSIKEALRENAFAGITANLDFTGTDGRKREFEFNTTRYTVIFTGEKLPGGRRADAVHIELHPRYHEMLKESRTRPLDYEYLKGLPPSAQRLYELLSFPMFGALKHGRPVAQMFYSEFCESAPLTRYKEWEKVKKQLYKIHEPHRDSGYIESIEFEETTDSNGGIDWLIRYTPGDRAHHEFGEFSPTPKREFADVPVKAKLVQVKPQVAEKEVKQASLFSSEQESLLLGLIAFNVKEEKARELVEKFPDRVQRELEAFPHRKLDGVKNPAGLLIKAIESGEYSQPPKVEEKRAKAKKKASDEKAKQREQAREAHKQKCWAEFVPFAFSQLDAIREQHQEAFAKFEQSLSDQLTSFDQFGFSEERKREATIHHAEWFFNDAYWQAFQIPFVIFWEWDAKHNSEPFQE